MTLGRHSELKRKTSSRIIFPFTRWQTGSDDKSLNCIWISIFSVNSSVFWLHCFICCYVAESWWCLGAWWLWWSWSPRKNFGCKLCTNKWDSISRHLPWNADRSCGVCSKCVMTSDHAFLSPPFWTVKGRLEVFKSTLIILCATLLIVGKLCRVCWVWFSVKVCGWYGVSLILMPDLVHQVLGLEDANSTEFDSATPHPCVVFMPEVCIYTLQFISFWQPPEEFAFFSMFLLLLRQCIIICCLLEFQPTCHQAYVHL